MKAAKQRLLFFLKGEDMEDLMSITSKWSTGLIGYIVKRIVKSKLDICGFDMNLDHIDVEIDKENVIVHMDGSCVIPKDELDKLIKQKLQSL